MVTNDQAEVIQPEAGADSPELEPSVEARERATTSVFGAIGAVLLSLFYLLARRGFENPPFPVIASLGIALFIVCAPFVGWRLIAARRRALSLDWWASQPFLAVIAMAITAMAGMSTRVLGAAPAWVVFILGTAAALFVVYRWLAAAGPAKVMAITGSAVVFFIWAGGVAWSARHKFPLFQEALEYRANVHHDALFNSAVGNMIQAYGIPSTGIDGVPYVPYHYGASWLLAQWADLAGTDLLSYYNLGPTVVMIPVFACALLLLVVELRSALRRRRRPPPRPLELDYVAAGALLAGTIGIIPSSGLDAMGVWNRHLLISESYTTGLPVFLFVAAVLLVFHDSGAVGRRGASRVWFALLVLPVLLAALGFLKVSLMILTFGVVVWAALRLRLWREPLILGAIAISTVTAIIVYKLVSLPSQNEGVVPLAFMRSSVPPAWWPWFPIVHLFWSWVYVAARVREEGVRTVGELFTRLKSLRLLDVELVAAVALAGFIPGEIIEIHGGSAFYLSDVQRWIALPLVMATAARWVGRKVTDSTPAPAAGASGIRLSRVALLILAVPLLATALLNAVRAPETALRQNLTLRHDLYALAASSSRVSWGGLQNDSILRLGLERAPKFVLVSALRRLNTISRAEKNRTALFIPQADTAFWNLFPEPERCDVAPLAGPAISGLAMIDGMPAASCPFTDQYAFGFYQRRTTPQVDADLTDQRLCGRAAAKGFSRVVVLGPPPAYAVRRLLCARGITRAGR